MKPGLARLFLRTGFVYLLASLVIGIVMAIGGILPAAPSWIGELRPVYIHLLVLGWVTQMIFGVALWMFPRLSREQPHGNMKLAWACYISTNFGLLLRTLAEPIQAQQPESAFWSWTLVIAAIFLWIGGATFVLNTWRRIK